MSIRLTSAGTLLLATLLGLHPQPSMAQAFGQSFGGLQMSNDQPISIESDQLDIDDSSAVATFTGNVAVAQGETQLKTGKLLVHYVKGGENSGGALGAVPGGSNQIEKLEASEKVYVKSGDQVATADRATFNMSSQVVVMTGEVVLSQGQNVATGCVLTIQMETGLASLQSRDCPGTETSGGRVKMMLTPGQGAAGN